MSSSSGATHRILHTELNAVSDNPGRAHLRRLRSHPARHSDHDLDLDAATALTDLDHHLDAGRLGVETRIYQLLALQQPVAGDLRALVSGVKIAEDSRRILGIPSPVTSP